MGAAVSKDLSQIVAGWDHDPDEIQVRIVVGDDGRDKLQMRVDLGVLQMEIDGRPDGRPPEGFESLLDFHEHQVRELGTDGDDYLLDEDSCSELMREGVQYYHRYLSLFHLERYDLVVRDTSRNLRLFAFVKRHATRMRDKIGFDQYRPYVLMMRARARGLAAIEAGEDRQALAIIDEAAAAIRAFLREYDQSEREGDCRELAFLLAWRAEIDHGRSIGPVERLEEQLARAVDREDYEEAAQIRDQLRRLSTSASAARPDAAANDIA